MSRAGDDLEKALLRAARKALEDAADRVVELAVQRVPVDSGDLQRSISRDQVQVRGREASVRVAARSAHAAPTEYGSAGRGEPDAPGKKTWGPYKIRPKHGEFLRWEDAEGEHFAREVEHPGVAPRPYMRPALDAVRAQELQRFVQAAMEKELGGLKGKQYKLESG